MARSLPDSVRSHALGFPENVAITMGPRSQTYGEIWREIVSFAEWLKHAGFKTGDRAAIVLANCPEAVVACYGTWLAGGIAVPLNAQAKSRELAPWLRHCDPAVIIYEAGNTDLKPMLDTLSTRPQLIFVGDKASGIPGANFNEAIANRTDFVETVPMPRPDDTPAMILFTSGTTGSPKGVTLSHRNISSNAASVIDYLGLTAADSSVSVLPFYYAYGNSVLSTHLAAGGRIVLELNMVFPHVVVETIARERVSGFSGVPSTFALLLSRVDLGRHDLRSLRYITQAGGPMPVALTRRLLSALPNARLFVMYGQTEATSRLTWLPPDMLGSKIGSVGKAIPGVELEIRSEQQKSSGTDRIGEVWARGDNVMLGYWGDEVRTSEVLHDGWLKTGDMGRIDTDGFLFLEGRRTDMIKVGANRIYPNDVEEAIAEFPGIAEVAVIGIEDELLGQVVKAFVVPVVAGGVDKMAVQAHCRARLAPYKIPKHVEFVESLPKTASGKINRGALADAAATGEES